MIYLPRSLTVLGGGIIALEYASIFAALGVQVTIIDRADRPLQFFDAELVRTFVQSFEHAGGHYCGGQAIREVRWDGIAQVVTTLQDGQVFMSDKMLVAVGRQANIEDLNLGATGLNVTEKGALAVNEHCQTAIPHIYGIGDLIGPPGLASSAMEQGPRAVCHALGLPEGHSANTIPVGIYTILEMSGIGLDEMAGRKRYREVIIGRARFNEIARGQISDIRNGLLKMVADPTGEYLLGIQIVGEGATELIHLGQMALQHAATVDSFVENISTSRRWLKPVVSQRLISWVNDKSVSPRPPLKHEAPRSKLQSITELNFEDSSEAEANPVGSYGEYSSLRRSASKFEGSLRFEQKGVSDGSKDIATGQETRGSYASLDTLICSLLERCRSMMMTRNATIRKTSVPR